MSNRLTTWELKAVDNLPDTIERMKQIVAIMQQQQNLSANSSATITKQLADITKGYESLQSTLQGVLKGQQDNTKAAQDAATAAKSATDASTKAANEARTARQAERAQLQQIQTQYESMRSTYQGLATITAAIWSAKQIKEHIAEVVTAQSKLELFGQTLTNIYQNSQKASSLVAGAISLEQRSPFNLEQIVEATQRMAAMGVESEKLLTYLESLGNISSLVGLQKLPLLAKALTDVRSKQILYAQEIRQFTDNGVPLYDLLASSMNKTREEVVKLAQEHKIGFAEVERAIISASAVGGRYYKAMETQAASLAGQVSNMESAFTYAKARVGDFFEGAIAKGIGIIKDLTNFLFGSESAIKRTYEGAKTAAAGWLTYQFALITVNTALRANGVANLAAMAQLQGQTIATVSATTATGALRTAWTGLTLAFRANPIGLIVTALSLLVTGFMAAKTATEEVNLVTDTATDSLRKEKIEMAAAFQAAMFHAQGTDMRKAAITSLSMKYPELLKYTDLDKVSNEQLNKVLVQQIGLLDTKIKYAAAAARADALYQKGVENAKAQLEVLSELRKTYDNISKLYTNDDAFIKAVQQAQAGDRVSSNPLYGVAYNFDDPKLKQFIELQKESLGITKQIQDATLKVGAAQKTSTDAQIKEITRQISALDAAHKQKLMTDADYNESRKKLLDDIKRLNGEEVASAVTTGAAAGKAKKDAAIFTAKELDVLAKGIRLDTLKDQLELIEAQKRLEMEQINHSKRTRSEAAAAIKEIVAKAEADKKALIDKYSADREALLRENLAVAQEAFGDEVISSRDLLEAKKFDDKEAAKSKKEANKEIRLDNKKTKEEEAELQKQISAIHKMDAEIIKNRNDIERDAQRDRIKMAFDYLGAQEGIIGQLSKVFRRGFEDIDLLNGKTVASFEAGAAAAQARFAEISKLYEAGSDVYKKAEQDVVDTTKKVDEAKAAALKAKTAVALAVLELLELTKNAIVGTITDANKAIAEIFLKLRDITKQYYNDVMDAAKSSYEAELEAFTGTHEEKMQMMREFYAEQMRLAEGRDAMDAQLTFNARMLEINTDTTTKISSAWDLSKGPLGPQTLFKVLSAWKDHNAQLQAAAFEREAYEEQLRQQRIQQEIDAARKIRDAKIDAIKEEADAYKEGLEKQIDFLEESKDTKVGLLKDELEVIKDNYRQQTDAVKEEYDKQRDALRDRLDADKSALQEAYDFKQSLLEQSTNDEIDKIGIVDRVRNEALERYRTSEVNKLIASRDRILATLTDEGERAAVIAEYDRKIKDVHDDVEEAKLDKTKGVSLATKQLRAEEKDESIKLKGEEKTAIQALEDKYQADFKALADERDQKLATLAADHQKREEELNDKIKAIETSTAADIKRLKGEIAANDAQAKMAMTYENEKYRNFVIQANIDMLNSQKAMAIAQIKAEIAILKGKRNIFNAGRINAAIGDLNAAIQELEGVGIGSGGFETVAGNIAQDAAIKYHKGNKTPFTADTLQPVTEAFNEEGTKIELTYTDEDRSFYAKDASGNTIKIRNAFGVARRTVTNPDGTTSEEVKNYFQGTPYIDGIGYPSGRDTVPAMVNKGERVMQTHLNEMIGGARVSNEELAAKKLFADKVLGRVADIRGLLRKDTFLAPLPEYMVKGGGASDLDAFAEKLSIMASGGTANLEELAEKIAALINKPSVSINVSPRGLSVKEKGQQMQNETCYENTGYKRKLP